MREPSLLDVRAPTLSLSECHTSHRRRDARHLRIFASRQKTTVREGCGKRFKQKGRRSISQNRANMVNRRDFHQDFHRVHDGGHPVPVHLANTTSLASSRSARLSLLCPACLAFAHTMLSIKAPAIWACGLLAKCCIRAFSSCTRCNDLTQAFRSVATLASSCAMRFAISAMRPVSSYMTAEAERRRASELACQPNSV